MRIRKYQALSSIPTAALSNLQLQRPEAAPPPPDQPSDHSMAIYSKNNRWVFPENERKDFGDDETLRVEANKSINNGIRKVVNICDGGEGFNRSPQSSSSSVQGRVCEGDNKVFPLKKRKGSFERNPNDETRSAKLQSRTNKICGDILQVDQKPLVEENGINPSSIEGAKKSRRGNVIMEGSRCSRVNGRRWRCCQPTLVGYSLCKHHLGKGRLRSMASVRHSSSGRGSAALPRQPSDGETKDKEQQQPFVLVTKKRTKVGVVKARSISSLLGQI